jgi:hypothetical protein
MARPPDPLTFVIAASAGADSRCWAARQAFVEEDKLQK